MSIVGRPIASSGGGVSDISGAYDNSNGGVAVVAVDSPYTVTESGSVRVLVDTTAGAVTINPPASPSEGDQLKIIDAGANAGTNIITITGLGTIETDTGSREYRYDGAAWELVEAFKNILSRDASTGRITAVEPDTLVANSLEAGSAATTVTEDYAGFINIGANISGDGTSYISTDTTDNTIETSYTDSSITVAPASCEVKDENNLNITNGAAVQVRYSTDNASTWLPAATDSSPVLTYGSNLCTAAGNLRLGGTWLTNGTVTESGLYDVIGDDFGSNMYYISGADTNHVFAFDFTTAKTVRRIRMDQYDNQGHSWVPVYSDDGTNWTDAGSEVFHSQATTGVAEISGQGSHRYWGIRKGSTSNNTPVEYDRISVTGMSIQEGATFDTKLDLSEFKALANIVSAGVFQVELTPVGAQRISAFDRVGPSSILEANGSEMAYKVDGQTVFSVGADGTINGAINIVGTYTTTAALETAYPAASNSGEYALIGTSNLTGDDGLWYCDGVSWDKILDDSEYITGDRTQLFDFDAAGVSYETTNLLTGRTYSAMGGTLFSEGSYSTDPAALFDEDTGTKILYGSTNMAVGAESVDPFAAAQFIIDLQGKNGSHIQKGMKIQGKNSGGTWVDIPFVSVSGDATSRDGTIFDKTNTHSVAEQITVNTTNSTAYYGYRLFLVDNWVGAITEFHDMSAFALGNAVDPDTKLVRSINRVHAGNSKTTAGTALTADTLLDNDDYVVELDATGGAFTMTLPAVATVLEGKRYIFKKVDASVNAITLDGNGAETIDGAATNATALAAQWDKVEIISNGTEWLIIG